MLSRSRKPKLLGAVVILCTALMGNVAGAEPSTSPPRAGDNGNWATWQKDLTGSRFAAAEHRITADNVENLKLKWAFVYPTTTGSMTRSEPAVVGDTIYFGGTDGKFYARDARSGAAKWEFDLASASPDDTRPVVWDGPAVSDGKVFFGDAGGYFYALDTRTGSLKWSTRLDTHSYAGVTSSPIVHEGRVYVGVSGTENAEERLDYPCCTFRGHLDSLDADTGELTWRYYTVPEPRQTGTWPNGVPKYEPSGVGVWSSPVIDPRTGTLYIGTGQNYTGSGGDFDTLLALDAHTGGVRWKNQVTKADTWRVECTKPDPGGYCPGLADGTALDYDIGATPNIVHLGDRTLVGVGQKSGVYHMFDARTGTVEWRRQLGVPDGSGGGGQRGIQWGSSYDGKRLYIASYKAEPGTLFAVDPADGDVLWRTPNPADGCTTGGAAQYPEVCTLAHGPAATSSPGLVWEASNDGKLRAYDSATGRVRWTYDTIRTFTGVNGLEGMGSTISGTGGGAVIAHGMVYVQSGYLPAYGKDKRRVLLAFGI